jgi:hypothetical protein
MYQRIALRIPDVPHGIDKGIEEATEGTKDGEEEEPGPETWKSAAYPKSQQE